MIVFLLIFDEKLLFVILVLVLHLVNILLQFILFVYIYIYVWLLIILLFFYLVESWVFWDYLILVFLEVCLFAKIDFGIYLIFLFCLFFFVKLFHVLRKLKHFWWLYFSFTSCCILNTRNISLRFFLLFFVILWRVLIVITRVNGYSMWIISFQLLSYALINLTAY